MRRRRVLTVVESLQRGGAERLVVTSMARLSRRQYDLRVVSLFGTGGFADELRAMKVRVYEFDLPGPRALPGAVRTLSKILRNERIDVVHTHLFHANVVGRLASRGRVPVVTTLHNPDYTYEDNGTLRFRARKWLDRVTGHRWTQRFLAVSEAVREDYERHMGFPDIEVLHNYMPVSEFSDRLDALDREQVRIHYGLKHYDFALLHVGRFHRQKAQDHLLRAFHVALEEEPRLRLLLAGDGPAIQEARVLAQELDLQDAVIFLGMVEDVTPLYAAADAFAFPSRWEAFGIALLEAMAAGLPAVVSDTGGITEVATPESAIFVPVDRIEPLALAFIELARDRPRRERMAAAARARARDFDVGVWIPRLEEVYASVAP